MTLDDVHFPLDKVTGILGVPLITYPHPTSLLLLSSLLPRHTINSFLCDVTYVISSPEMHSLLLCASPTSMYLSTPSSTFLPH